MVNPKLGEDQLPSRNAWIVRVPAYTPVPVRPPKGSQVRRRPSNRRQANEATPKGKQRTIHLSRDLAAYETSGWPKGRNPYGYGTIIVPARDHLGPTYDSASPGRAQETPEGRGRVVAEEPTATDSLTRMGSTGLSRLKVIDSLNSDQTWVNRDLYRLMFREDLYVTAYERIKSNPGNMTPGVNGETLDGFSLETVQRIIKAMRDESFDFTPGRRVYIPKPNGKQRPLTIAPPKDKVVQEVIRMILSSIYDGTENPTFLDCSHGFRARRGCHTALKAVGVWKNVAWFVEGDIKGCFDNVNHHDLISILTKRIADERFIGLIWKALRAGYFEFDVPRLSLSGTPQGSIVSPILANIYLHELDLFVSSIKARHDRGDARRVNPEYRRLKAKAEYWAGVLKTGDKDADARIKVLETIEALQKAARKLPSMDVKDPNYTRVHYIRYADDWLMGVTGPKSLAEELREEVRVFLADTLKLELSLEKTHIRHARTEEALFLGTTIQGERGNPKVTTHHRNGTTYRARATGWNIRLKVPAQRVFNRLVERGFCSHDGSPKHVNAWIAYDDAEILNRFNSVLWGVLNYYAFASNFSALARTQSILQISAAKTLAAKHRLGSVKSVFRSCGPSLQRRITINGEVKTAALRLNRDWQAKTYRFMSGETTGEIHAFWQGKYTRSRLGMPCAVCGREDGVVMHHVRHVRTANQRLKGFHALMAQVNRKQVPVCKDHHEAIHNGSYDGISPADLARSLAHWNWV